MPSPSSVTVKTTSSPSQSAVISTCPSAGVWRRALSRRFPSTCVRRCGLPTGWQTACGARRQRYPLGGVPSANAAVAVAIARRGRPIPVRSAAWALLGLGQCGDVVGEADQSTGLIVQHRDGLRVKGLDPVLDGFHVGLEHRDRCADLVGEVAEHLSSGGLHRFKALRHPVERRREVVEVLAQLRW